MNATAPQGTEIDRQAVPGYYRLMPFKSQAQRRKFAQLLVEGKISPETYEEWNRETGSKKLPERVKKQAVKKTPKGKTRPRSRTSK